MPNDKDFDHYVSACDFPGVIDPKAVEKNLADYLGALGLKRNIVKIEANWQVEDYPDLLNNVRLILEDLQTRNSAFFGDARDALAARAARAARAALDARDARDALDALDALAARDARAIDRFAAWCLQYTGWSWWRWDCAVLASIYLGAKQTNNVNVQKWSKPVFDAFLSGAWFLYWTENTLYWVAKPVMHNEVVDGQKRLHNESYAAIESDVENIYFWHGVMVPAFVVTYPQWIKINHIETESNAEVRRVMIERYESVRYNGAFLHDCGAREIQRDEYGILYRKDLDRDEPIVMVRLLNRTPEAEGNLSSQEALELFGDAAWRVRDYPQDCRWKEYYKRVHPELRPMYGNDKEGRPIFGESQKMTARAAVASTRGLYAEQYYPEISS